MSSVQAGLGSFRRGPQSADLPYPAPPYPTLPHPTLPYPPYPIPPSPTLPTLPHLTFALPSRVTSILTDFGSFRSGLQGGHPRQPSTYHRPLQRRRRRWRWRPKQGVQGRLLHAVRLGQSEVFAGTVTLSPIADADVVYVIALLLLLLTMLLLFPLLKYCSSAPTSTYCFCCYYTAPSTATTNTATTPCPVENCTHHKLIHPAECPVLL